MKGVEDIGQAALVGLPHVGFVAELHGFIGQLCVDHKNPFSF
jgi:hypothetical protein